MSDSRLRFESCGKLGVWIYIDDKLMDIFHLSDLQKMIGIKQTTIDAIEQIYNDLIGEEE